MRLLFMASCRFNNRTKVKIHRELELAMKLTPDFTSNANAIS